MFREHVARPRDGNWNKEIEGTKAVMIVGLNESDE